MVKTKFEALKEKYPDAVEYNKKTQGYVSVDCARLQVYKKDVKAKLLFENSIPTISGVTQIFVFSVMALKSIAS